ncbi:hypothetical protein DSO57_1009304 [Entomophthora muscae]|uniref:Uncharacterized protein n=1 Tax=Entomophthora muscae TaxID=34485 RepID=A0ACC2RLN3_9FUNG|nr:hypothetical protein DSO57_1009304 [Entomophthora muscae]
MGVICNDSALIDSSALDFLGQDFIGIFLELQHEGLEGSKLLNLTLFKSSPFLPCLEEHVLVPNVRVVTQFGPNFSKACRVKEVKEVAVVLKEIEPSSKLIAAKSANRLKSPELEGSEEKGGTLGGAS